MKRIVIADDSSTARMFARKCLEIAGCREAEYIEVPNGEEALKVLAASPTDLLVTDLNMPGIDGLKLLLKIRADSLLKNIPVIVVTSVKNPAKEAELRALGASAVLPKPVSPALMAKAIQGLSIK